jgi:CelD/BcsL family acetyltransferase involved in cellulose biosynthesis
MSHGTDFLRERSVPAPADEARAPDAEIPRFSDEALLLTDAPVPGRKAPLKVGKVRMVAVTSLERLASIQSEWQELGARAAEPNPFYEPWMLLPALRAFGAGKQIRVLLALAPHPSPTNKGGWLLCGVFPVEIAAGRAQLWKHPYCYLCTPLLRPGYGREAVTAFFDWLERHARLVRLEDVPGDGPFRLLLVEELYRRRWAYAVSAWYTRALFKPASNGQEFLERSLNGKRRKELRRQRSRLAEQGRLELAELRAGEDCSPWVEELLHLETNGWKGRKKGAAVREATHRAYLAEMAKQAHERGRVMMMGLRLDGRPIALKYNLLAGEGSFAFKIAYDETFARFSPGVLLELHNVERLHERRDIQWMDSCAAPNRFMINHLWPDRREMQTLFFATGGLLASVAVALVPAIHLARSLAKRIAERFARARAPLAEEEASP